MSGTLPYGGLVNGKIIFNNSSPILLNGNGNNSQQTLFDKLYLGQFSNPLSSNWIVYESLIICNDTHVLYSNLKSVTVPKLISMELPQGSIKYIKYNEEMRINTEETVEIGFNNFSNIAGLDRLIIKIPTFFIFMKNVKINGNRTLVFGQ